MGLKPGGLRGSLRNISVDAATPDSAVSRWSFNDADTDGSTAVDVWGSDDGTINGATTGVSGELGEAYEFDGSDDEVEIGSTSSFDLDEFSASVWCNFSTPPEIYRIVFRGNLGDSGTDATFDMWVRDSDGIHFEVGDGGSKDGVSTTAINYNQWEHVVGTFDGSEVKIYINGAEEDSTSTSLSPTHNGKGLLIGTGENDRWYDGKLDDPRIYDKALSSNEVDNLYNEGNIDG